MAGNSAHVILGRALVVMILSWMAGRLLGALAQHYVHQTIEQYKLAHPILQDEPEAVLGEDEEEEITEAVPERFGREFAGGLPGSGSGQSI